jgi:hypothetical protein
MTMLDFYALEE